MTPRPSLLASLRVAEGALRISAATLVDAARGQLDPLRSAARLDRWSRRALDAVQIELRLEGREHLTPGASFVVMSNHQSHLDIPCLYQAISPRMLMVAKKELFQIPLFGPAMRAAGFIEVDRADRKQAITSLQNARTLLSHGSHVWIAPEGTRSLTGELGPFKKGGFVVALDTGTPILPVGLHGTRDVLPVHTLRASKGHPVGVVIGQPIPTAGKNRDALVEETRQAVVSLVERARALAAR